MARTDLEIHQQIMDIVDEYTGISGNAQPRYKEYPYPQRLDYLSANLKTHVLRETGNIELFLALHEESGISATDPAYQIAKWLETQLDCISHYPTADSLVVSLLVFGDEYADKLINYTLPSLMSPANFPALKKHIVLYIQTTQAIEKKINDSPIAELMKESGIEFFYVLIPESVASLLKRQDVIYWMLGASATLGIEYAKSRTAAFHHSYPDIVYSEKFFSELQRIDRPIVLGSGMRSDQALIMPILDSYRQGQTISIPSADLMAHHLDCIHNVSWPFIVNHRSKYWDFPISHVMIWESEEHVHINSPHLMAHWLSYEVIKELPKRYYMTLDSEMDLICTGDFYVLQENDEAYQVELSPSDRQEMSDTFGSIYRAATNLWGCVSYRDTMKFFFTEMKVRINREIRKVPDNCITQKHVETLQKFLYNVILASDPYAGAGFKRKRTHIGWIFE